MKPRHILIAGAILFAMFIGVGGLIVHSVFSSKQYLQNSGQHVIKQFDSNGHVIGQWTSKGVVYGTFNSAEFYDAETGLPVKVTGTLQITVK